MTSRSRANTFLKKMMNNYNDKCPPNASTVAVWKRTFNRLLDDDMAVAETHEDRLKLKAVGVAGAYAFDGMAGAGSQTTLDTFNDLVALAAGERGNNNLDPVRPRRSQRTAQQDWDLARAIVALKEGYDRYPGFEPWLRKTVGKSVNQIRKIIDNMDQQRGPYETVKTNIVDIKRRLKQGEDWMFDDLQRS